jgi:GTPase
VDSKEETFRSGFVSIIGRPNVGKSTLLNKILGQKIAITSPKPQTTRNRLLGIHHLPDGQILFLDTPGLHRGEGRLNRYMMDQALAACSGVDAILLLVEADRSVNERDELLLGAIERSKVPVILAINKIDLVPPPRLLPLIDTYAKQFPFRAIIPISAQSGAGLPELTVALLDLLPPGPRYYPEDMVTDLSERFIVAEMVREQVLRLTREEIPYGVAVVVESFTEKPQQDLVTIQAAIVVSREAHKKIIVGKGGAMIRAIGQGARKEIEKLLGNRVYLELFVKVEKNWTESPRQLKDLGYE